RLLRIRRVLELAAVPVDLTRVQLVVRLDTEEVALLVERERVPVPVRRHHRVRITFEVRQDAMRREDLESRAARRDEHRERSCRLRMLLTVGNGGLVAMVTVRDQQRAGQLELLG